MTRDVFDDLTGPAPHAEPTWPSPLSPEALQGLPGRFVRTVEAHSEGDPVALLLHFLAICGAMIGRDAGWQVGGALHSPTLFVLFVGDTASSRKGTAASDVRRVIERVEPGWWAEHKREGLSSGEGVVWHVRDPIKVRRKPKKGEVLKADADGFIEEIDDPGVTDKRLLIVEPEFAGALKVMAREGNTLSPTLRAVWDDGTHGGLTKNSPFRTTNAQIAIAAHITTLELRRLMTATEQANGFGNRFLYCCVERSRYLPFGGSLDDEALDFLARQTSEAVKAARVMRDGIVMAEAARDLWRAIYEGLSDREPDMLGFLTARAEAQIMRLAVTYSLLSSSPMIELEHLRAALAVWRYCEDSAAFVFGGALGNAEADRILAALSVAGSAGLTRTEIRDALGRHASERRIEVALTYLRRRLLVAYERVETGGRPAERWRILQSPEARPKPESGDQSPASASTGTGTEEPRPKPESGDQRSDAETLVAENRLSSQAEEITKRLRRSLGGDREGGS